MKTKTNNYAVSKLIFKMLFGVTQGMWSRYITHILGVAYETRILNSEQLHTLCAQFDPTQKKIDGDPSGAATELREAWKKCQP